MSPVLNQESRGVGNPSFFLKAIESGKNLLPNFRNIYLFVSNISLTSELF